MPVLGSVSGLIAYHQAILNNEMDGLSLASLHLLLCHPQKLLLPPASFSVWFSTTQFLIQSLSRDVRIHTEISIPPIQIPMHKMWFLKSKYWYFWYLIHSRSESHKQEHSTKQLKSWDLVWMTCGRWKQPFSSAWLTAKKKHKHNSMLRFVFTCSSQYSSVFLFFSIEWTETLIKRQWPSKCSGMIRIYKVHTIPSDRNYSWVQWKVHSFIHAMVSRLTPAPSIPRHHSTTSLLKLRPCWGIVAIHQPIRNSTPLTIQSSTAFISGWNS